MSSNTLNGLMIWTRAYYTRRRLDQRNRVQYPKRSC